MSKKCTIQYNEKFALKNSQTHCQFNLAHKLKRTELFKKNEMRDTENRNCLLYTSPSPRDRTRSRMPSSA